MEYATEKEDAASTGDGEVVHPVRRGVLRDIDEMEKLMDNLFNFELAAYAGAHTPVRFGFSDTTLFQPLIFMVQDLLAG